MRRTHCCGSRRRTLRPQCGCSRRSLGTSGSNAGCASPTTKPGSRGKAREFAPDAYLGKRTSEERITEIKDLARSLGLDAGYICGRFSYEKIVEAAGDDADLSGDLAVFTWRLFSGFAHGRYWAMLGMLDQVRHPTDEPDVAQVRLTTTVDKVIKVGHIPFVLTRHALDLFERRRRSPYGPA